MFSFRNKQGIRLDIDFSNQKKEIQEIDKTCDDIQL